MGGRFNVDLPYKPNYTSIVLWLKHNMDRILLGGDLEEADSYNGWSILINGLKSTIVDSKANVYKVVHHGSITGHHEKI